MVTPSPDSQTHGDKTMANMTPGQAAVWRSIFADMKARIMACPTLIAHSPETVDVTTAPAPGAGLCVGGSINRDDPRHILARPHDDGGGIARG